MGLLEKLRPQPRWKNPDPAVRLDALKELDDPFEFAALAELDTDARVRRASVGRVQDPEVLARIAREDADAETRDRAADRLLALASGRPERRPAPAEEGAAAVPEDAIALALAAVQALDARRLSVLAKSEAPDPVRAEALARIGDERALGSIARHARHETTAAAALARLTVPAELLEVALHADHRDVAVGAFERIAADADLSLLRSIEARAQQKPVSKRARTMIQQIESAEAAERAAAEERQQRESGLCDAVEQVASIADVVVARAELDRLTEAWRAFGSTNPECLQRFARAVDIAEETLVRRRREAEEAADRRRLRAEAIATRDALCARVETLEGDDALEQLVPIEEEWRSLLPLVGSGPDADRLAERFSQAVATCRRRHALRAELASAQTALDSLVAEAEGLVSADAAPAAADRWPALARDAQRLTALLADAGRPTDGPTQRLAAVRAVFDERQAAADAEVDKERQAVLAQLQRLADRATRAAEADSITLREGERLLRDLVAGFDATAKIKASREMDEALGRLRELQEKVAPRVRELREMDEWRRFANAQRQEQLIAMAEAIVTSLKTDEEAGRPSDLAATARALRELHTQWHEVAEAPRHLAQRLWSRFRTATDFLRSRCEIYFAKMREERQLSVQKKAAIVEEAESLVSSSDWSKTALRFQQLQTEWKESGPVPQEAGRELAQRFRTASNAFFARRREDMADRKKIWSENLVKKEALCERVETLAGSTDWDATAAEIKRLQAEWKTIGPVRRNKSDAVWNRFRTAADRFFENYHRRHEIGLAAKLAEREVTVVELETLATAEVASLPADVAERVKELRATWNRAVPVPTPGMKALADRWQAALKKVAAIKPDAFAGTDLDPQVVVQRMQKLVDRVEALLADAGLPERHLSQTEMLAARLRSAFASNAMGGRANEETKTRAAADTVRDAQAAWQRLAPVSSPEARALEARFRDACRRLTDRTKPVARPARRQTDQVVGVGS